jgi:hypothetical protein
MTAPPSAPVDEGDHHPMTRTSTITTSTELAVAPTTAPAAPAPTGAGMPSPAEWTHIQQMATVLADSDLVPTAYRRKPANIVLASLAGRPFGWDPTMSMRSFHVIEGVPSMKPEVMLALVRRAGHSVTGEVTGTGADHPRSMCWARALSQLCRMLFPDVVLGAGYTPEELGARISDDDIIDVTEVDGIHVAPTPPATVTEAAAKNRLLHVLAGDVDEAREAWLLRPASLRPDGDAHHGTDDQGRGLLEYSAVEAWITSLTPDTDPSDDPDVVDAELVDPDETDTGTEVPQ